LTGGQEVTDGGEQVEKRQLFGMYAIYQETIDDSLAMHTDSSNIFSFDFSRIINYKRI
jgi:hypothetical protein